MGMRLLADFVGWFSLLPPEGGGPEEAEPGYRLRRSAWGRGYATEGAHALIREGFFGLGVRRVFAQTRDGWERSSDRGPSAEL